MSTVCQTVSAAGACLIYATGRFDVTAALISAARYQLSAPISTAVVRLIMRADSSRMNGVADRSTGAVAAAEHLAPFFGRFIIHFQIELNRDAHVGLGWPISREPMTIVMPSAHRGH